MAAAPVAARVCISGCLLAAAIAAASLPAASAQGGARILSYLHSRGEALDLTTPSPVKSVYIDYRDVSWSYPNSTVVSAVDGGYTAVILAFYLSDSGPTDMLQAWATAIGDAERAAAVAYAHSKGAIVLLSLGGATDATYYTYDAATLGKTVGAAALNLSLDGVDFDLEGIAPGCTLGTMTAAQTVAWMAEASVAARLAIGPAGFITHAPQAPYFGPISASSTLWAGPTGCYTAAYQQATYTPAGASAPVPAIDWMAVQFYNQGPTCYTTYEGLMQRSAADCAVFPGTSLAEIASYGVPLPAIVVGKYLLRNDASNGFVSAGNLSTYFATAKAELGWGSGVMCWAWQAAGSPGWISTIYPAAALLRAGSSTSAGAVTASGASRAPAALPHPLPSARGSGGARILSYLHGRGEALHIAATPSPVKSVYIDARSVNWTRPDVTVMAAADGGYNVIILAFYMSATGPSDMVQAWATAIGDAERAAAVAYAHSKGAIVLLSLGGATDTSYYTYDAATLGRAVAEAALNMSLDGVDMDLEGINEGCTVANLTGAEMVAWQAEASIAARLAIGPAGFLTHAPESPNFGPVSANSTLWAGPTGCITGVYQAAVYTPAGASAPVPAIDWMAVQFYNQGKGCYITYEGLMRYSAADCKGNIPGTSVAEIASYGVPLSAIVVGKYLLHEDASNGWVSAANLSTYFATAKAEIGWDSGVMCWEWDASRSPAWLSTIYPATPIHASSNAPAPAAAFSPAPETRGQARGEPQSVHRQQGSLRRLRRSRAQ